MRLAFDVGKARIGVARCDQDAILSFPVVTLRRDRYGADLDEAVDLVEEYGAFEVIVGLPKHMGGGSSSSTRDARQWARDLASRLPQRVCVRLGEVRLASADLGTVGSADAVRSLVLDTRSRLGDAEPAVVAIGAVVGSRPVVVVATNAGARDQGIRAGALVRTAAQVLGGGGGGKDDLAQGGGQNPQALDEALRAVAEQIQA